MQSALCCAYIPEKTVDIAGDTCINAARRVLNTAFGTDLPEIEPRTGYVLDDIFNAHPKGWEEADSREAENSEKSED